MTRVRINIHQMLNTNRSERYQKLQVDYKAGIFLFSTFKSTFYSQITTESVCFLNTVRLKHFHG